MKPKKVIIIVLISFFVVSVIISAYQRHQEKVRHDIVFQEIRNIIEEKHDLIETVRQIMKKEEYSHLTDIRRYYDASKKVYHVQISVFDRRRGVDLRISDIFTREEQTLIFELFSFESNHVQICRLNALELYVADCVGSVDVRVIYLGRNEEVIEGDKSISVRFEEVYDGWYAMITKTQGGLP